MKVGDELTIQFGQKRVTVKVTDLKETTKKEEATGLYELIREERTTPAPEQDDV
ncbi:hypothetical protein LR69_02229 [Geobacillus sp. BCO2]|nr:hypothetical protein LR69_02229 [Geobacillus sp. BCO2]